TREPAARLCARRLARGAEHGCRHQPLDAAGTEVAMATHEQIQTWDSEHVIHPWSFAGPSLLLVRGEGSSYFDAEEREYLDALGGIQLCEIGHGRAELAQVAAAQMAELEYAPMFWNFGNERAAELAHRLVELAPDGIGEVFFALAALGAAESEEELAGLLQ